MNLKIMSFSTIVSFFACILLWGCSSSSTLTVERQRGTVSYDDFNNEVRNEEVSILFQNGSLASGTNAFILRDTLSWTDSAGMPQSPVSKIRSVSIGPNRWNGGLIGFLIGGGAGGLLGMRVGGAVTSGEDHGLHTLIGAGAGAVVGGVLGGIVGIASAQDRNYIIVPPEK